VRQEKQFFSENGFSKRYRFFFLLSFFQALASHLDQRMHMSEEREKENE